MPDQVLRDMVVDELGEKKTALLERLVLAYKAPASMSTPMVCGALIRKIAAEGGMFGWTDSRVLALGLKTVIEVALDRLKPDKQLDSPGHKEAITYVTLLVRAHKGDEESGEEGARAKASG